MCIDLREAREVGEARVAMRELGFSDGDIHGEVVRIRGRWAKARTERGPHASPRVYFSPK